MCFFAVLNRKYSDEKIKILILGLSIKDKT